MSAAGNAGTDAQETAASAKLMVVIVGLAWGFNWVAARIILEELGPWSLRAVGIGLGTLTLFAAAAIGGISLAVPRGERMKILIAGLFNVAIFNVLLGLRAGLRHHLARHRHRLFDADLGVAAGAAACSRKN